MDKEWLGRLANFLVGFVLALLLCLSITGLYSANRIALEKVKMEQLAMNKANKVNNTLTDLLYKVEILSALVVQNDGEVRDFNHIAATISDNPSMRNVLLAPDGVVEYVYPMKNNEAVIGLDFFSEKAGNKEAILAKQTGQLVLGGPFELVQGGQALVGRMPVYVGEDEHFWGIASVTLDYPQALDEAELDMLANDGFIYEMWRINPDTNEKQIIASSKDISERHTKRYVEYPMTVLNAQWYFRLFPIKAWYQLPESWLFMLAGFAISVLIGVMFLHNYDLKLMKKRLEKISYTDPLTSIMNRRAAFIELEKLMHNEKEPFVFCYIDMDRFKYINDEYGHAAGDYVLKVFADTLEENLSCDKHIYARIGGDEFIVIFKNTDDCDLVKELLLNIQAEFKRKTNQSVDSQDNISFSHGCAVFPIDGTTTDKLMAIADSQMYSFKNAASKQETHG